MAFYRPSSFAEFSATVQHINKQEDMLLRKRVAFMERQERQATSTVSIDQKLLLMKMKSNLDRSIVADEKIGKIKDQAQLVSSGKDTSAQMLKDAWDESDPLGSLNTGYNVSTHSPLPLEVALPAALMLLRSKGRKVDPSLLRKVEKMESSRKFSPRNSTASLPDKLPPHCKPPLGGRKHRRASSDSNPPSASIKSKNKKTALNRVSPDSTELKPPAVVRPSSAPKTSSELQSSREFATALWVASQDSGRRKSHAAVLYRPPSPKQNVPDDQNDEAESSESSSNVSERVPRIVIDEVDRRTTATNGPHESPDVFDIIVYDEATADAHLDELQRKLSETEPQISLIDLHRAAIAAKSYPSRIKRFIQSIHKYKSATVDIIDDYYCQQLSKTSLTLGPTSVA